MPVRQSAARKTEDVRAPIPVARPQLAPAEAILPYLQEIDDQRWYSNFGPLVTRFEARLAERLRPPASVVTTANGTSALSVALQALSPAGGLCAMPSWTFAATAHAALKAGLTPWFLDVDPESWMLEPETVRAALASAPGPLAAVAPVAAFGRMPDLLAWAAFREETGVPVVLDAAAAFDALVDAPVPIAVSLHATKVLGVGEGGYLASEDAGLIDRVRQLTSFGFRGTREAQFCATNAKMSEYAAAVGHASLDHWAGARLRWLTAAQRLRIALVDCPQVDFQPGWGLDWVSSSCVVRLPHGTGAEIAARLQAEGVDTRRWWGEGCHVMPAFADMPRQALPNTAQLAQSTLGLPFASDLEIHEINLIADVLRSALAAI